MTVQLMNIQCKVGPSLSSSCPLITVALSDLSIWVFFWPHLQSSYPPQTASSTEEFPIEPSPPIVAVLSSTGLMNLPDHQKAGNSLLSSLHQSLNKTATLLTCLLLLPIHLTSLCCFSLKTTYGDVSVQIVHSEKPLIVSKQIGHGIIHITNISGNSHTGISDNVHVSFGPSLSAVSLCLNKQEEKGES